MPNSKEAVLHFTENGTGEEMFVVFSTCMKKKELEMLAQAIANIKEHADRGEELSDFEIPDRWKDLGFKEKISLVCGHITDYVGVNMVDRIDTINTVVH